MTDELTLEDMTAVVFQLSRKLQSSKAMPAASDKHRAKTKELGSLVGRTQECVLELEKQYEDERNQVRSA